MRNYRNRFLSIFIKIWDIINNYKTDIQKLNIRIQHLESLLRNRTDIAADLNFNDMNTIIVIGKYRNLDYVQTYHLQDINSVIEYLEKLKRTGTVKIVDCPPQMKYIITK